MNTEFSIAGWEACAPGLTESAQWLQWAESPVVPFGDAAVALQEMPPMLRRRLGDLGRWAAHASYACHASALGIPVVLASRYGDAKRSLSLLQDYATGQPMSPTDFALSVHNAIGALYSIARKDGASYSSIAGGAASAAAGVVEAAGLLADGAEQVLLVCYDAALPGRYAEFADEPAASYAWAWRLARPQPGQPCMSLRVSAAPQAARGEVQAPDPHEAHVLPFGLDVLRFALSQDTVLRRSSEGFCWEWQKHG